MEQPEPKGRRETCQHNSLVANVPVCVISRSDQSKLTKKILSLMRDDVVHAANIVKRLQAESPSLISTFHSQRVGLFLHFDEAEKRKTDFLKQLLHVEQSQSPSEDGKEGGRAELAKQFLQNMFASAKAAFRSRWDKIAENARQTEHSLLHQATKIAYKALKLNIPMELLLHLFSFLSVNQLITASIVCKQWYKIINCVPVGQLAQLKGTLSVPADLDQDKLLCTLARFGKLVTKFDEWPRNLCKDAQLLMLDLVPNLEQVEELDDDQEVVEAVATKYPKLRVLHLQNVFESDMTPFFARCKELEEIHMTSDESDISVDGVTGAALEVLAANTSGKIREINMNACVMGASHAALAKVIAKSPQLDLLVFKYDMYHLEELRQPPAKSEAVDALVALNKRFKKIVMNFLSKSDKLRVAEMVNQKKKQERVDDDEEGDGNEDDG